MNIKQILNAENHGCNYIVEADVVISDGEYEIFCYFNYDDIFKAEGPTVGKKIKRIFGNTFIDISAIKIDEQKCKIEKSPKNNYQYLVQGQLVDKYGKIKVNNLTFETNIHIDKDIIVGDFIQFYVDRFDCFI